MTTDTLVLFDRFLFKKNRFFYFLLEATIDRFDYDTYLPLWYVGKNYIM